MEATSPTKRRVLGQLDPNASPRPQLNAKQLSNAPSSPLKRVAVFSASPSTKRPLLFGELAATQLHPAKKVCQEDSRQGSMAISRAPMAASVDQSSTAPEQQRQTASPEPSSLFDSSAIDTSQATNITEPDVVRVTAAAAAATATLGPLARPVTRPRLTREEAREKAEILKLRLGLASYKLRTGQTDIPLEQLEMQSATRHRSNSSRSNGAGWASTKLQSQLQLQRAEIVAGNTRRPLPAARRASDEGGGDADQSFSSQVQWSQDSAAAEEERRESGRTEAMPLPASWELGQTPRRAVRGAETEETLNSSALRGGAAKGLLSLAHARG